MSQLQECPDCIKYNIGVTLMEKDGSMVCPVCESIYWELSFPKNNLFFKLLLLWKLLWTTWINPGRLMDLGVVRQIALVTTFVLSRHDFVVFEGTTLTMSEQHLMYSKLNLKLWLIYNSHPSQKIISN